MASVKPSAQYVATFNRLKKNGLTEKEMVTLSAQASKEIASSSKPHELAAVYTKEVKGWVAKGLTSGDGTPEMLPYEFKSTADGKVVRDALKVLSGQVAALAKNPALKGLDFKSLKFGNDGDGAYVSIADKKGTVIGSNDPRVATLRKALGPAFKQVAIGTDGGGC